MLVCCVEEIIPTKKAFAARKSDGTYVVWGNIYCGGETNDNGADAYMDLGEVFVFTPAATKYTDATQSLTNNLWAYFLVSIVLLTFQLFSYNLRSDVAEPIIMLSQHLWPNELLSDVNVPEFMQSKHL
ncbi:hypothetical protein AAMO2058_001435600 [Amorphochlora amoebiformis]